MSAKNTILGALSGSLICCDLTGDEISKGQLLEYLNTLHNGKFRPIEYCKNIKKIIDEQLSADKILVQVLNHEQCEKNPTKAAADIDRKFKVLDDKKYMPTDAALIRAIPSGFFENWVDMSILSTMSTHMDHRCIASGLIISSIVRELVLGLELNLNNVIPETLDLIYKSKQMSEEEFKELVKFTLRFGLEDVKQCSDNYIYKSLVICLRTFSHFINNKLTFEEGIEYIKRQDIEPTILPILGALFGSARGYDSLSDISEETKKSIDNIYPHLFNSPGVKKTT